MKRAVLSTWIVVTALAAAGVWWMDGLAAGPRSGSLLFVIAALAGIGLIGAVRRSDLAGRLIAVTAASALTAVALAMKFGPDLMA